jgi:hypothetical protein
VGYLLIDNRVSGGVLEEYQTVPCKHCRAVLKIVKGQREGYWCNPCGGHVCPTCAKSGRCDPFFAKIERWQQGERFAEAAGLQGG